MENTHALFNCQDRFIEKDIVLTSFKGNSIKSQGLVLEVNGVYHYARNSEEPLGKDVLKQRVLTEVLGYEVISIPYFDWSILENNRRRPYLEFMIDYTL